MIACGLTHQWHRDDNEFSTVCFEFGSKDGFLILLVGCMGVIVWVGVGLGSPPDPDEGLQEGSEEV